MSQLQTFFYSLKKSLFEPKYYKDVASANFGFSFKYLLCLLFILVIFKSFFLGGQYLKSRPQIQPEANRLLNYAENFYPRGLELKIRNGQLSTNVKGPYIFDLEKNESQTDQRHLLIIDTKGSIENYPNYNTYILATKNAVVYPSKSTNNRIGETSVFYFRDFKQDFTLNKNIYDNFFDVVRPYAHRLLFFVDSIVLSLLFLFLIFGSFFWTGAVMFRLLFLTLLVWIVNFMFKRQYSYGSLYKMGMHAATWPILVAEVIKLTKIHFPNMFIVIFFVWIVIILFSLKKQPIKN